MSAFGLTVLGSAIALVAIGFAVFLDRRLGECFDEVAIGSQAGDTACAEAGEHRQERLLGRGLINPEPKSGGCEDGGGEVVPGQLVEAGGDSPEVPKPVEEASV
jgi:hypothetical protein